MNTTTNIAWTDATWNPVTGCTKCSPGCLHCYTEGVFRRFSGAHAKFAGGFGRVVTHDECLSEPLHIRSPKKIFVCSMSDLFHPEVPDSFIDKVMETIKAASWHTFQLLTKRPERMADYFRHRPVPENAWLGTTVECRSTLPRIDLLKRIPAKVRFLSCEPLLEDIAEGLADRLDGVDWIIVGVESGPGARKMERKWVDRIYAAATQKGCPFFFKQWGLYNSEGVRWEKGKAKTENHLYKGKPVQQWPKIS